LRQALSQADERFARILEEMQAAAYVIDEQRGELLYANPEVEIGRAHV
jgi:PAS domain-containing protein